MYVHKCRSTFIAKMTLYGSILCQASESERERLIARVLCGRVSLVGRERTTAERERESKRERERTNYGGARKGENKFEREREKACADDAMRERTRKSEHA